MLWIIPFLIFLELNKYCHGNMAQYDQWKLDPYRPNQKYSRHKRNMAYQRNNSQYSQDQDTFGSKSKPKIEKEMDSIEESSTIFDNKHILRRDSRNSLHRLRTSYSTANNLQDSESQNSLMILHRDSIDSKHDQSMNQNTIGLKNVRFFRRNNHWKPKRLISLYPTTNQHDRFINSGYDKNEDPKYKDKQNQNAIDSQVYSDCCIVMSNTITIHKSGLKPVHNFKAPDYLPPVDRITPNYNAPEYLPPNTGINDIPNNVTTTTSYRPVERGDVPEEEDPTEEPAMAMPVPPEPDELTTAEETSTSVTTSSRVTPPISENTSPIVTTMTTYSTVTSESRNIGEESLSTLATITSFKGLEYLPPDNNRTTVSVMTPEPDPAMARPVQPEPNDNDTPSPITTSSTTTSSNRYQTEEHRPSTFVPFTGRVYLSPATTTTSIVTTAPSGVAPAMAMSVPPEPEDEESTSSPISTQTDDTRLADTTTTPTTTPTLTVSDTNPLKAPYYLPPKMIPALLPAPAMVMPVLPEAEDEPSISSTLSTSTDDFKPAEKSTTTTITHIAPDTDPFKAPDYLPPKMASAFPLAPAMAMLVPPEPEDKPSTSLPLSTPTDDFISTEKSTTTSIPMIPDTDPFKAPDYLPPKMVPVLTPAPAIAMPVPKPEDIPSLPSSAETSTSITSSTSIIPENNTIKAPDYLPPKMAPVLPAQEMAMPAPKPDRNPNDNPNIDPRSFAADGSFTP